MTEDEKKEKRRAAYRARYAANREHYIAKTKRYYEKNKAKVLAAHKKRREINSEKIKKREIEYRKNNRQYLNQKQRKWREANREIAIASVRKWYEKNKVEYCAKLRRDRKLNPEKSRANSRAYYASNRPRALAYASDWAKKNRESVRKREAAYREKNRGKVQEKVLRRYINKKRLIHPEYNPAIMAKMITEARRLGKTTGIPHSVDHIIPLAKGGWHHQDNLQIIPKSLNSSKGADPFWISPSLSYKDWRDIPRELWPVDLVPKYLELIEKNKGLTIRWAVAA